MKISVRLALFCASGGFTAGVSAADIYYGDFTDLAYEISVNALNTGDSVNLAGGGYLHRASISLDTIYSAGTLDVSDGASLSVSNDLYLTTRTYDYHYGLQVTTGGTLAVGGSIIGNPDSYILLIGGGLNVAGDISVGEFSVWNNYNFNLLAGQTITTTDYFDIFSSSITQTGGTNNANQLVVSDDSEYNLQAGDISSNTTIMSGVFNQTGGVHTTLRDLYATGTYNLSAGTLNTENVNMGAGLFNQTGGQHVVSNTLFLAGSDYALSGGSLSAANVVLYNGSLQQTGGKHSVSETLILGQDIQYSASYNLEAGILNTTFASIGNQGKGQFLQNGGSHTVSGQLHLGAAAKDGASYTLNNGELQADTEFIGVSGYGYFNQSGGLHSVKSEMILGDHIGETGNYDLNDGRLYSNDLTIGIEGDGDFAQIAGEHQVDGLLLIGDMAGGTGSYNLLGGTLNSHPYGGDSEASLQYGNEVIGYEGTGTFTQTGGTHTIKYGPLTLGYNAGGAGTYNLSNPTSSLVASSIIVGKSGTGTFNQDGGAVQADSLMLGGEVQGNGTYTLKNGILDFESGGNFINVRRGEFTQTNGSTLALHIEGKDTTSFVPQFNANTISVANLAGKVSIDSQTKVVNGNLQKIVHGDLIPVVNARNVNLNVASHITAGGNNASTLDVTLGNVKFATQFYNNGPTGVGFLTPAHLKYDDHESLGLIAVAKASAPVAGAIWAPVPQLYNVASYIDEADKQKQILQSANNFVQPPAPLLTSPALSAAKLAKAAYSSDPLPGYLTLSSLDVGAFRAVAYQNEMQAGDIVIAVRGSDNLANWYAGNPGFSGISTDELSQYVHNLSSFTAAVYAANSNASIKLVGHSLGGGLAQLVGYEMGVDAYGFNAPGIGNLLTIFPVRTIFPDDTAVIRDLYVNPNGLYSLDSLVNITLSGDVVSGWVSNSGLSPKVGQTITLPEDPLAYALKHPNDDPIFDVVVKTMAAPQAARINHSIVSVIARLDSQLSVVKVEKNGEPVALQTSLPSLQDALDRILTPTSSSVPLPQQNFTAQAASIPNAAQEAAAAVSFQGSVQEGLFYLGGANPNFGYGFSFEGALDSPNFQSVLLPFLGDDTQQFEIDIFGSDGAWTKAGDSGASTLFEFGDLSVKSFRILSLSQLAQAGADYTDIYFGLTFAADGNASGSIVALGQSGEVLATPVPASVWLLGSGLLGLIGVARRKAA